MSQLLEQKPSRHGPPQADDGRPDGGHERRQFRDSHSALIPDAQELAEAIAPVQAAAPPPLHHLRRALQRHGEPRLSQVVVGSHVQPRRESLIARWSDRALFVFEVGRVGEAPEFMA